MPTVFLCLIEVVERLLSKVSAMKQRMRVKTEETARSSENYGKFTMMKGMEETLKSNTKICPTIKNVKHSRHITKFGNLPQEMTETVCFFMPSCNSSWNLAAVNIALLNIVAKNTRSKYIIDLTSCDLAFKEESLLLEHTPALA